MTVELRLHGATLALDDAALDQLAAALADRVAPPPAWLNAEQAAEYIAAKNVGRIYALVSAKRIPHHRDGSRLLFRAAELDDWVSNGGGKRP